MSEVKEEQDIPVAASEQPDVEPQEGQEVEPTMVPLAALKAERKKRQEETQKRQESEAKAQLYQEYLMRAQEERVAEPKEPEDPNALVEKHVLKQTTESTKREILETLYQDMNPEAVQKINKYLKPILEKKPWLASSVDTAQNRYARAYEIVQDYLHLVEEKPVVRQSSNSDGKKIIENAQKPRSPVEMGKSAQPGGSDYLKSIQGKKEFREYRQKVLRGEA
jgi:hypothetical protein